jgi:hypothetical protein
VIGAFVFYTGNEYGEIFWRLICGEGPGVLFFLVGLYYTLKYFSVQTGLSFTFSLCFLTLAALTKESFILLMPLVFLIPLVGSKDWKDAKKTIIKHKNIYLCATIIFLSLIILVAVMLLNAEKMFDYGSPLTMSATIKNNLYFVVKWFFPFLPFVALAFYFIFKLKSLKTPLQIFILSLCWIIVHIIIYHKVIISFSMGKYIMPGGLIFIGLLVFSLEYIKLNTKLIYKLSLMLLFLVLIRNAKITYIIANEYAAKVSSFNQLIDTMIEKKQPNIAIYGGIEIFMSMDAHFKVNGYFPKIYSSKVIIPDSGRKNEFQNDDYENAMLASISDLYPTRTLEELGNDSTVKTIIIAEPMEVEEIDESYVLKYFPNKHEVFTPYNNPKFSDLIKPATLQEKLLNSNITYLYFSK